VGHLVTRRATPVSPRHRKRAAAHHEAVAVPTPGMRRPEPPLIHWPAHRRALHLAASAQSGDRSRTLLLGVLAVALLLPLLALPFVGRRRY
jgi:hypothetical protein